MRQEVLIATTNNGKLKEFELLLKKLPQFQNTKFLSLNDLKIVENPYESRNTFQENAIIKADYYLNIAKIPVIAEDSGFCVLELNCQPGVESAHWGKNGDFSVGIKRIYQMLGQKTSKAYFQSVIVFKSLDLKMILAEGIINGRLAPKPKGTSGFGFDPCFIPDGFTKTFAEMTIEEKSAISHRKIALQNLIDKL